MIRSGVCNQYKLEALQGLHQAGDRYMIALYSGAAELSPAVVRYEPQDEVVGEGYAPGGQPLTGFSVVLDGNTACVDWHDPVWGPPASITARGALIYNASRDNRAVVVVDFGAEIGSEHGRYRMILPTPAEATAIVRLR